MPGRSLFDLIPLFSAPFRVLVSVCLFVFLSVTCVISLPHAAQAKKAKYASIVMDADTGMILHQRYANRNLHPASLTKIMTLLMVFEEMERGKLSRNDRITISKRAASMVPSKIGLEPGDTIRVRDAIYALVTKSANDVAVGVAEHIAGSEAAFAQKMTKRAREIGMYNTTFKNASGLHSARQVSTARDMAKLAHFVITRYPQYYRYFSRKEFTYRGVTYRNHNRLLDSYPGIDGMKTGYINAAGFNLVASAVRNNQRLIGVVFGGRTGKSRNAHMAALLDDGFAKLNEIRVASARMPLPPRKPADTLMLAQAERLNNLAPTAGDLAEDKSGFAALIGQGDSDPAVWRRIETGLLAMKAHKQVSATASSGLLHNAMFTSGAVRRSTSTNSSWSIQVGAFADRHTTNKVLQLTQTHLPHTFRKPAVIAPMKTHDGWLYRARLVGYTKADAYAACRHLADCMPVAPQNNR